LIIKAIITSKTTTMTHKVIPMFRIFDYNKAIEFYVLWLGFIIDWEDKPANSPIYMQVSKDDIALHLTQHHGDCCPGSKVFIECSGGLKEYHQKLIAANYIYNRPGLGIAEWNALTMEVVDPFCNKLLFVERFPSTATV
jgi:hypothetical protein